MSRFSSYWMRCSLIGVALLGHVAWAVEFRTTREQVIVYDSPSLKSKKLSILSPDYPLEILDRDEEGWLKIRDMSGDIGWVEEQSTATRKRVIVRSNSAEILRQPDTNARLAFRAEKGVVLERLSVPDEDGWVRVRIPNTRQEGYIKTAQIWGVEHKKTARAVDRRDDEGDRDRLRYVASRGERDLDRDSDRDDPPSSRKDHLRDADELDRRARERRLAALREEERELLRGLKRQHEDEPVRRASRRALQPAVERSVALPERRRAYRQVAYREDDRVPYYHPVKPKHHPKKIVHHVHVSEKRIVEARPVYAERKPVYRTAEQEVALRRASERERLRQRRLRAEQAARDVEQDQGYKQRPMLYSTRNRNSRSRQEDWDRGYTDEDRNDRFAPPQVHR